jgi:hypothetical protein
MANTGPGKTFDERIAQLKGKRDELAGQLGQLEADQKGLQGDSPPHNEWKEYVAHQEKSKALDEQVEGVRNDLSLAKNDLGVAEKQKEFEAGQLLQSTQQEKDAELAHAALNARAAAEAKSPGFQDDTKPSFNPDYDPVKHAGGWVATAYPAVAAALPSLNLPDINSAQMEAIRASGGVAYDHAKAYVPGLPMTDGEIDREARNSPDQTRSPDNVLLAEINQKDTNRVEGSLESADWKRIHAERALHEKHVGEVTALEQKWGTQPESPFGVKADEAKTLFTSQDQATGELYAQSTAFTGDLALAQKAYRAGYTAEMNDLRFDVTQGLCGQEAQRAVQETNAQLTQAYATKLDGANPEKLDAYQNQLANDLPDDVNRATKVIQEQQFPEVTRAVNGPERSDGASGPEL